MLKRLAALLLFVLVSGCRTVNNSQATPTPLNSLAAQAGATATHQPAESQSSASPEATPRPMTPQDYLATSVARNEPEYPISTADRYQQVFRPQYHFSAVKGWLGDPDGMVRFNGIYQLFWWGHAESKDLVHWNERIQPMIGDDGSFAYYSGSVVVDEQNSSGLALN